MDKFEAYKEWVTAQGEEAPLLTYVLLEVIKNFEYEMCS